MSPRLFLRQALRSAALCAVILGGPDRAALADVSRADQSSPVYPWKPTAAVDDLERRFPPPPGSQRIALQPRSFGQFLRKLPLLPAGSSVKLFDGRLKARQDVHAAVVDLDVGQRDLQQCADAIMRLRAEFLFSLGRFADIRFHPDPGRKNVLAYSGGNDRSRFNRYLLQLFSEAGSASLQAELQRREGPIEVGDVLIQGGHPGHAVLVLDVAEELEPTPSTSPAVLIGNSSEKSAAKSATNSIDHHARRYVLLAQSYMPAQQFHVLRNLKKSELSPWFEADFLDGEGLKTPEWPAFTKQDLRRFE